MSIYTLEPFTPKRYSVEHLLMFFSDISQRQHDVRRTFVRHLYNASRAQRKSIDWFLYDGRHMNLVQIMSLVLCIASQLMINLA